jgi:hypothetical protein
MNNAEWLLVYERILDRYEVDELVGILEISVEEILDAFRDKVVEKIEELDV